MTIGYDSLVDPAPRPADRRRWPIVAVAVGVAGVPLVGAILMPSVTHCGPSADQAQCWSNLKQIDQAIQLYAAARGGTMPDSFASLLRTEDLVPEVFLCPNDRTATKADGVETFNVWANASYAYLGDGLQLPIDRPEEVVIAIERRPHEPGVAYALLADGTIEMLPASAASDPRIAAGVRPLRWKAVAPPTTRGAAVAR